MISPRDVLMTEPSVQYLTYSYKEGFSASLKIIVAVSIFTLISMIISLIIGIRKKDCLVILVGNIMVKTVVIFMCQILNNLLYLNNTLIIILFFIGTTIIEGFIYKKVLKYKKYGGMIVSVISNTSMMAIIILMLIVFQPGLGRLLNLLL